MKSTRLKTVLVSLLAAVLAICCVSFVVNTIPTNADTLGANSTIQGVESVDIVGEVYTDTSRSTADPGFTAAGAAMTVLGVDKLGTADAWKSAARINYNGQLNDSFKVQKNDDVVSVTFKLVTDNTGNLSQNGNAVEIHVRDCENPNKNIAFLRIWFDQGTNDHPVSVVYYNEEGKEVVLASNKWMICNIGTNNSFTVEIGKDGIFKSYCNGNTSETQSVGDSGASDWATYTSRVASAMSGVNTICFDVKGFNGFNSWVQCVVTDINGQSLANDGSKFLADQAPDLSNIWNDTDAVAVGGKVNFSGEARDILTDLRDVCYDNNGWLADNTRMTYEISSNISGGFTYVAKSKTITLTKPGVHTITVKVTDKQGSSSTRNFTVYAVDLKITYANVRFTDYMLRFNSTMDKAIYDQFVDAGIVKELGWAMAPTAVLGSNDLVINTANVLKIESTKWSGEEFPNEFSAVLKGITAANNGVKIKARSYITLTVNNKDYTIYSNVYESSLSDAASIMINDVKTAQDGVYDKQVTVGGQTVWSKYGQSQITKLQGLVVA